MDSLEYEAHLRLFNARRLHPWLPEHALFIAGELAKLEVVDKTAAVNFREFYEKKMDDYEHENMKAASAVEDKPEPEATEQVEPAKKRGRKPKSL